MIDLEGDPALWSESWHGFCRAVLAGVPGGTAVVFDDQLRVRFAEGETLGLAGLGSMVGRRLPDVLPAASWELPRGPYEAALGGRTSTCDFNAGAKLLSIHVSPFALVEPGRAGLAVSREVGEQDRVESAVVVDDHLAVRSVCSLSTDITERRDDERTRQERLQCSVEIHAALAQDRFVLHGQPILNLTSMQVEQAELLLRMRDANGGDKLLAPGEFLPAAERFDQISLIDEWVLDRAVELAAAGHRVDVNIVGQDNL